MPFQKGHKLSIGRPKGKPNIISRKARKFLEDLAFDKSSMIKDWNKLDLRERMEFRIRMAKYIYSIPKAPEPEFVEQPLFLDLDTPTN